MPVNSPTSTEASERTLSLHHIRLDAMPAVPAPEFATRLAQLVLVQEEADAPEFADFDKLMKVRDPDLAEPINTIREHVAREVAPAFENVPRIDAVLATFMYGVLIGQKLARYGVTGVAA